jgi:hypothetical protein
MKIAICITGLPKGNYKEAYKRFEKVFPNVPIYSATWDYERSNKNLPASTFFFEQPTMHYHPLADIPKDIMPPVYKTWLLREKAKKGDKISNGTFQILCHSLLLKSMPGDYDMIIRSRWDTHISSKVDFHSLLQDSYNNKKAIGFGVRTSRYKKLHTLHKLPHIWPERHGPTPGVSNDWGGYIMDPMIFHRRDMFNHSLCWTLHNEKKLMSAERGWYQLLSQPYNDNHDCFYGGAQLEQFMKQTQH